MDNLSFTQVDASKAGCLEKTVTEQDLSVAVGSGSLPVLGTPILALWMEEVCHKLAETEITDPAITSVGCALSLEHLAPTAPGKKVRLQAEVTQRDDRRVSYQILAFDEAGLIGKGEHTRVFVKSARFLEKMALRSEKTPE